MKNITAPLFTELIIGVLKNKGVKFEKVYVFMLAQFCE